MSAPVEGQQVARALLEAERALIAARCEWNRNCTTENEEQLRAATQSWELAWHDFWCVHGKRLLRIAGRCHERIPSLGEYEAGDLVQEFLVMVGRKLDVMLGVVSRGEKPLWPRLARSLRNFCNSLARSGRQLDRSLTALIDSGFHPPDERDPGDAESREANEEKARRDQRDAYQETQSHLDSIRRALPPEKVQSRVPFLHLVLLKARLVLLTKIVRDHLLVDEYGTTLPADFSPKKEVERLYQWTESEYERQLPLKGRPMLEVWNELADEAVASGFAPVTRKAIATALGMPVNTLNQYLKRARLEAQHAMERLLGSAFVEQLFREWFC